MSSSQLILASQSPRRAELLSQLQVSFTQHSVDIDETPLPDEAPQTLVARLAGQKARAGVAALSTSLPVLGSDTIVVANGEILGKPADETDCARMLRLLSDNVHQVMTSVAIASGDRLFQTTVTTDVTFKALTEAEIRWYWKTGEPSDKAGGYGIQGLGGRFVRHLNGSYSAVVGLPLFETSQLLTEVGIDLYEC